MPADDAPFVTAAMSPTDNAPGVTVAFSPTGDAPLVTAAVSPDGDASLMTAAGSPTAIASSARATVFPDLVGTSTRLSSEALISGAYSFMHGVMQALCRGCALQTARGLQRARYALAVACIRALPAYR